MEDEPLKTPVRPGDGKLGQRGGEVVGHMRMLTEARTRARGLTVVNQKVKREKGPWMADQRCK